MNILLHACCGPCSIFPLETLQKDHTVSVFFFNPNIHPFQEFKRRQETLLQYCQQSDIPVVDPGTYGLNDYLQRVVFHEADRCAICYRWRMEETAKTAVNQSFTGFSTTLLYSRYQDHEALKRYGFELADIYGVSFIYSYFRKGWRYGIDKSKEYGMYRQPYCGCIYSEQERYDSSLRKK
ncbi:MAG: epoxyqueuosine reductase QueH [Desulfopila sp.]